MGKWSHSVRLAVRLGWIIAAGMTYAVAGFAGGPVVQNEALEGQVSEIPDVRVQWINIKGKVLKGSWPTQSRWVWTTVPEFSRSMVPVVRTWIALPAGAKLVNWEGSVVRMVEKAQDSPLKAPGQVLSIDTFAPVSTVTLQLKFRNGQTQEIGTLLRTFPSTALDLEDDSCLALGFRAEPRTADAKHLFSMIFCDDRGDAVDFYVLHAPDSGILRTSFAGFQPPREGFAPIHIPLPTRQGNVGTYVIATRDGLSKGTFQVTYSGRRAPLRRLTASMNLGPTYLVYTEGGAASDINLTEVGITGKLNLSWTIIPKHLDLNVNSFVTLLPLMISPNTLDPTRAYGINFRLGYRLPVTWGGAEWNLAGGMYLWGMITPNQAYGISLLTGPQVFCVMRKPLSSHRFFYSYFKFAPISDRPEAPSMDRRELALGGGITLNRAGATREWILTLDAADARFSAPDVAAHMDMTSLSLGIQTGIY